ncbi:holdfast anchoring protein HfaA [Hyphomonas sp. FCG-A18]|uniref:holdfast anchoring protein HfaA n=1 Tax=Hyphomonas sp. FCG-A18 TaxID=3080019 RepID=UPI002B297EC6|nr:holdfast anchoring protein HfaA [Hyphomonas sp. FCG-A18]
MNAHRLLTTAAALAIGTAGSLLLAAPASAQAASYASEFERPYGFGYGEEQRPYEANSRDRLGNRVIINGLIEGGTGLGTGLHTGWGQTEGASGMLGSGTAVGNQLNVITNGSNNTIIIDSTQINNGDQTVVLNGELDF